MKTKLFLSKMKILVRKQAEKMKETFDLETLAEENFSESLPEETLRVQKKTKKKKKKNKLKKILQSE